jgi:uncharacterized alpha-E superfamily protein
MLSRVASHLYWMARYLERAENMARILDVGQLLALVSRGEDSEATAIEPLVITDTLEDFDATGRARTPAEVACYLAWDALHASSIFNCLHGSRENARAVRADITTEMWEDINNTWLQLLQKRHQDHQPADNAFFEWVKERSHLFRGITFSTIRRDQPYHFIRLGTFIERADNTARILSVKQSTLGTGRTGNEITDYYRLSAVLRSVSAFEAYRDTYREGVEELRVAELLIVDPTLPRSLRFCFDQIVRALALLPGATAKPARRLAATMLANLQFADIEEIYSQGYRAFLERFLAETAQLGQALHEAYLEPK